MVSKQNIRLIFGLKLRQLRQERGYTAKELCKRAGISVSYLNEIEKGKKYPKTDKILSLAQALAVEYDDMVSLKLDKKLTPIAELLKSNLLQDLPLDMFGVGFPQLVEVVSNAPIKVSAFFSTLFKISRNYEMRVEGFYFSALRTYQELNDNYFEEIEELVQTFVKKYDLPIKSQRLTDILHQILVNEFNYNINHNRLGKHKELSGVRSIYSNKGGSNCLFINNNLNSSQKGFQLGKELGYQYLNLRARNSAPSWVKIESFEHVLNNFKASYFAGALLINREKIIKDIDRFFQLEKWNGDIFLQSLQLYNVSPETFLHRLTSILPKFFGLNQLFFLRFTKHKEQTRYNITKELHLSGQHLPQGNSINEHYCRRWITIKVLQELAEKQQKDKFQGTIVRVQRSKYIDSLKEYFCITVARPMYPTLHTNSSVTLGFLVNQDLKEKVKFWNDPAIPIRWVNKTCERCGLRNCAERAINPTVLERKARLKKIKTIAEDLVNDAC